MDENKRWRHGLRKKSNQSLTQLDKYEKLAAVRPQQAAYRGGRRMELCTSQPEQVAPNPQEPGPVTPILSNVQRPAGEGSAQRHQVSSERAEVRHLVTGRWPGAGCEEKKAWGKTSQNSHSMWARFLSCSLMSPSVWHPGVQLRLAEWPASRHNQQPTSGQALALEYSSKHRKRLEKRRLDSCPPQGSGHRQLWKVWK